MFKLDVSDTIEQTVNALIPLGDGKSEKRSFKAIFKRQTLPQMTEIRAHLANSEVTLTDRQLIDQVLTGWRGVQDSDGKELPFTPDNLNALLAIFPVQPSLVAAFFESTEVREKN